MSGTPAERALLGSLLIEPKGYRLVEGLVSGDDFTDQRMGALFAGIVGMLAKAVPVNVISVAANMGVWKIRLDETELHQWVSDTPAAYRAMEFADAVRDGAVRRGLADVARRSLAAATDPSWLAPDAVSRAINELEALRNSAASSGFVARKLRDILEGSDEYDWIIPGLLERRDRLVLTGAEGAGKTTFVRQLAVLAAAGLNPLTLERIPPVSVLVVDAENTDTQWRRAVRWMASEAARLGTADPRDTIHVMAGSRIDVTREAHLGEIHRLVDVHKPDALFIGPLYKLVPKAITNDDDAAPLIVALDSLRERGLTLVMEAHGGKSIGADGDRDMRPRGSAALLGWPEFGLGLQVLSEDPDMVALRRWRGDRDRRDWPKHLRRGRAGEFPWVAA